MSEPERPNDPLRGASKRDTPTASAGGAVRKGGITAIPASSRGTIEQVITKAAGAGAAEIELQFTDVTGAVKTVSVPTRRLRDVLVNGEWFDGSAIEGFAREVESDMRLRPDAETFSLSEPASGLVSGRLVCEVVTPAGEPYAGDGRAVLRTIVDAAAEAGVEYLVAPEVEFFLFPRDGASPFALTAPGDDASGYFERARGESRRVALEIVAGLESMGIRVESNHHEVAAGQFEVDMPMLPAVAAADTLTALKPAVRELALARGMHATFMPKPLPDAAGSGMHTHQVLVDGDSRNLFYDPSDPYCLSRGGRAFAAGQLEHAHGMCALLAPLVNSYKRLVPGYEAPVAGTWGRHNRSALVRVPSTFPPTGAPGELLGPRLELRLPDPSCNPYIAFAAMLVAGLDGVERDLELGPAMEEVEHSFGPSHGHAVTRPLPTSLAEALEALDGDDVLVDGLGSELIRLFSQAKELEIEAYRRQVTPWEIATYFERS